MSNQSIVASIHSVALSGYQGTVIEVETDTKAGLPSLQIVGMGNKAIDEARQRVRSAITNSSLRFPARKVTVNLAPAELPKDGTHFDLPIALSILVSSGQLKPHEVKGSLFVGELALDGSIRPIRGAITIAEAALHAGITTLFLPVQNVQQAQLVKGITLIGVPTLGALFRHLKGVKKLPLQSLLPLQPTTSQAQLTTIDDIQGHQQAKRALVIAAAGRHNLLFSGPPGVGKTALAKTLISLLPSLTSQEILEATKIHSLSGAPDTTVVTSPPLRSPHHSISLTALIGGGARPRPGEISLAHKGILLLDELPEFSRNVLEALRQPLEDNTITLSRLYGSITYPADIQLITTMNPCPCGYLGDSKASCTCSATQITHYQHKISGPLLDRIDVRLTLSNSNHEYFFDSKSLQEKQHIEVLKLINNARTIQKIRYKRSNFYNAYVTLKQAKNVFNTLPAAQALLENARTTLNLSTRSSLRILRIARTIADLDSAQHIESHHIAEAIQFRG